MKNINWSILLLLVLPTSVMPAQPSTQSIPVKVDCSKGESLNRALSRLNNHVPATVSVNGTCTEYVHVTGFDNLTLNGLPGAKLVQPSTGASNLISAVLLIDASQSVTVEGFVIQADTTTTSGISVFQSSSNIQLRNLNVTGGAPGVAVGENSQALLSHVTVQDPGWAALGIYDSSDVHVEHCAFQITPDTLWHAGIALGAAHVTMFDTVIKDMTVGINAGSGSIVDVQFYSSYTPAGGPTDVTIESPAATNSNGVSLSDGSSLNVNTKLVISGAGQSWGGTSGGVSVANGSTLNVSSNLVITGSLGQGIVVSNNSHANLAGVTVTGNGHGGLVLANLSSIDVSGPTLIGGNGVDLFCDSGSVITGSANLAGVPTSQCANVQGPEAALP